MPLSYILQQVGYKMGLSPSDPGQRAVMLRFVNEACDELYVQADMVGSLVEQCFKVNGDQTITLPAYVGELRAVRELSSMVPWNINQMRPRYNAVNWQDMWRNFRLKSKQALQRSIVNEGPVTVTCNAVESVVVRVSGMTTEAQSFTETLLMDALTKSTVASFVNIDSITKSAVTLGDYNITDMDGNQISSIPNNQLEARYTIIDISQLPWLNQSQSSQDHYVEVLYKKPLPWMSNDGDEFPAKGFDNIIVNKCLQLWCEEENKVDDALLYDQKATRGLARKNEEQNRATQDCVALVPNGHDSLLTRIRSGKWLYRNYLQNPRQ